MGDRPGRNAVRLVVARVGRAHGLHGEVVLDVRTDDPDARLAVGAALDTDRGGSLTVVSRRTHQGRLLVRFAQTADRTAAEALRGVELLIDATVSDEDDAWYPHELRGLRAELPDGTVVGTVVGLEHLPGHDLLVLRETTGERTLVPFVRAIVPTVEVAAGRVVLTPPAGLLARDGGGDNGGGASGVDDGGVDDSGSDEG